MSVRIINQDCREALKNLASESVQCCVTSPPYFGLRDYGTARYEGGDPNCSHTVSMDTIWNDPKRGKKVLRPETSHRGKSSKICHNCGAIRIDNQIGLEDSPENYVKDLVSAFSEVKRILMPNGVLWLNLGDTYAGSGGSGNQFNQLEKGLNKYRQPSNLATSGIKPKDLIGIPWMVAFALRADGWYLRQDIIWHKPNPMPESVKDRCTKAHEYIFLFSKSRDYFFDAKAICEPAVYAGDNRGARTDKRRGTECNSMSGKTGETRNKRSVWTVTTKPCKEAHFATYPPDLIAPCILAGSQKGDTILDPFFGAGTTGLVANNLGRNCIGIELNPDYAEIAQKRIGMAARIDQQPPIRVEDLF